MANQSQVIAKSWETASHIGLLHMNSSSFRYVRKRFF